ncbi:MAG TPA: oligosaccharide flippase family protein [Bacteroidia bacterium]|nr:oligosaccharide flippase family protein [Bacteroidia bacterium]
MINFLKKKLDPESKILFRNSSWVFFSNFFSTGLAFLRSILIARGLGVSVYGTYVVVVAFVGLIQEFLNLNIGTALIRYGAVYHAEGRKDKLMALVKVSLFFSFIMAAVSIVLIALLSRISYSTFISEPGLEWFIVAYAAAASVTYLNSVSRGLLRLYYKFRLSSIIQMIMDVMETIAIAIAVIFYPRDLNIFFVAVIITRFLNGFICNALAFWELRKELGVVEHSPVALIKGDLTEFKKYVLGNSLGNSLKTLISQGDIVLLRALTSAEQVGLYNVAKKLAYAVLTLSDPLVQSVFPQFSRMLAEKKFAETRKMILRISSLALVPAILFMVLAIAFSQSIIGLVYGAEYLSAAGSFGFFIIGATTASVTFWMLPLVLSLGLIKERLGIYVITIIVGVLLSIMIVPSQQAQGMALVLLITNVLNLVLFGYLANKKIANAIRTEDGAL